ncbi:hypothetical protein HPHPP8B_0762 [Helicobacter pylori Hp P-8b]|nr:hypothetical protein HPHPP8_0868 [Helicobacter pylori Hp P-8]EJC28205.1 hypothetical protein HPHPP8B_0762 [Helicobacter pylori Hp P-8b]EMG84648.1 hypothetical protein HMPREF1392_00175 [Helicobacter pylori GAM101Biv]
MSSNLRLIDGYWVELSQKYFWGLKNPINSFSKTDMKKSA